MRFPRILAGRTGVYACRLSENTATLTGRILMNRIWKMSACLVVCALTLFAVSAASVACQVDVFFLTKDGSIAAVNNETLAQAVKYAEAGRQDGLSALEKKGLVVRLKEDDKVQVLERSLEWKTLEIKFMNGDGPYWVKDGSLKRIESH
jgi:hypothetical protein